MVSCEIPARPLAREARARASPNRGRSWSAMAERWVAIQDAKAYRAAVRYSPVLTVQDAR